MILGDTDECCVTTIKLPSGSGSEKFHIKCIFGSKLSIGDKIERFSLELRKSKKRTTICENINYSS